MTSLNGIIEAKPHSESNEKTPPSIERHVMEV
jgi:hypothetical protein